MTNNDVSVAENPHVLPNPHYLLFLSGTQKDTFWRIFKLLACFKNWMGSSRTTS